MDGKSRQKEMLDPNEVDHVGRSHFYIACEKGDLNAVIRFCNMLDVDVNKADLFQVTPLFVASWNGHTQIVQQLLTAPKINVNQLMLDQQTPLFVACRTQKFDVVKILLTHPEIDPNLPNFEGYSPLHVACMAQNAELLKMLLKHPKTEIDLREVSFVANSGWIEGLKCLLLMMLKKNPLDLEGWVLLLKKNPLKTHSQSGSILKDFTTHTMDFPYKLAAEILVLIVLYSDRYLQLKPCQQNHPKVVRFFKLTSLLPLELQTLICNFIFEKNKAHINSAIFETSLKEGLQFW